MIAVCLTKCPPHSRTSGQQDRLPKLLAPPFVDLEMHDMTLYIIVVTVGAAGDPCDVNGKAPFEGKGFRVALIRWQSISCRAVTQSMKCDICSWKWNDL